MISHSQVSDPGPKGPLVVGYSVEAVLAFVTCLHHMDWERSGSVVVCLTRNREAAGSSLTGVTELWSLSKTHLS